MLVISVIGEIKVLNKNNQQIKARLTSSINTFEKNSLLGGEIKKYGLI